MDYNISTSKKWPGFLRRSFHVAVQIETRSIWIVCVDRDAASVVPLRPKGALDRWVMSRSGGTTTSALGPDDVGASHKRRQNSTNIRDTSKSMPWKNSLEDVNDLHDIFQLIDPS